MIVKLFDFDKGTLSEYVGSAIFQVANIMTAPNKSFTVYIQDGKKQGSVTIRASSINNTKDILICNMRGSKLSNKDGFFGKSDPFLVISRLREDKTWMPVFRNAPIMNNLSPTWPQFKVSIQELCNGDLRNPILIEIFDFDRSGKHGASAISMVPYHLLYCAYIVYQIFALSVPLCVANYVTRFRQVTIYICVI